MRIVEEFKGTRAPTHSVVAPRSNLPSLAKAPLRAIAGRQSLQSPKAMQAILHRECARCERSGSAFCLVVIDPGTGSALRKKLGDLLIGEARQTDEIGFLDAKQLCVFLPYTACEGAHAFMSRFKSRSAAIGCMPIINLYCYPHEKIEDLEVKTNDAVTSPSCEHDGTSRRTSGGGVEELLVKPTPLWKRVIDIIVASTALAFLWPFFLVIALAIKLNSKGPVFFVQWRAGLGGKPFRIYKFRTMVPDADRIKSDLLKSNEQDGPAFKMERDPRITGVGRLLRITSADELPQFVNILKGDMSLVGPRPLPVHEARACDPWHRRRLDVVPGLTCTWQITGRGTVSFAEWVRMDRQYIQSRSLIHDVKLLLLTVPAVLSRRGAK